MVTFQVIPANRLPVSNLAIPTNASQMLKPFCYQTHSQVATIVLSLLFSGTYQRSTSRMINFKHPSFSPTAVPSLMNHRGLPLFESVVSMPSMLVIPVFLTIYAMLVAVSTLKLARPCPDAYELTQLSGECLCRSANLADAVSRCLFRWISCS